MRFRALLLALLTIATLALSACGGGSPRASLHVRPGGRAGLYALSASSYDATFSWTIPAFPATTGYYTFQDGQQVGSPAGSPYVFQGLACGTTFTLGVQAHNGSGGTGPTYSTSYTTPACAGSNFYWGGIQIGTQFNGIDGATDHPPWDMNAENAFSDVNACSYGAGNCLSGGTHPGAGKRPSAVGWGTYFYHATFCGGACTFTSFASLATDVRNYGAISVFSWQSTSTTGTAGYTDAELACGTVGCTPTSNGLGETGTQDSYVSSFASQMASWGHPIMLRFDWEMNGGWFPWGSNGSSPNTAAAYVGMWRHVYQLFKAAGATPDCTQPCAGNVSFAWVPNIEAAGEGSLASLWPGSAYVQWAGFDSYNSGGPWTTFATNLAQQTAFGAGIASSYYSTNTFSAMNTSPIPP